MFPFDSAGCCSVPLDEKADCVVKGRLIPNFVPPSDGIREEPQSHNCVKLKLFVNEPVLLICPTCRFRSLSKDLTI